MVSRHEFESRAIFRATVHLDEMRKDVQLFEALFPLLMSLTQLQELVDDTCLAVGSEAYASALQVYNYAKASGQGSGLDSVIGEMGQRFVKKPRKPKAQSASAGAWDLRLT